MTWAFPVNAMISPAKLLHGTGNTTFPSLIDKLLIDFPVALMPEGL